MHGTPWDAAGDADLLRLLGEGYSARAAARMLGRTANAIIGRTRRLARQSPATAQIIADWATRPGSCHEPKIGGRHEPPESAAPAPKARASRPFVRLPKGPELDALGETGRQEVSRAMGATAFTPPPDRAPVRLEDLGDGCKWPLGDPLDAGLGFCGHVRGSAKSPYCAHHHAIAYTAVPARMPPPVDLRRAPSRGDRQFMGSLG